MKSRTILLAPPNESSVSSRLIYLVRAEQVVINLNNSFVWFHADVPANILLEKFGEKFLDFCQDSGYDRILQVLGATPRDFLQVVTSPHP